MLLRHIAIRRALEGALLACGAPLGWLALLRLSGDDPVADLLRARLADLDIHVGAMAPVAVTASFGVAEMAQDGEDTPRRLFNRADEAMYRAKEAGRNSVMRAGDRVPAPVEARRVG